MQVIVSIVSNKYKDPLASLTKGYVNVNLHKMTGRLEKKLLNLQLYSVVIICDDIIRGFISKTSYNYRGVKNED